MRRIFDISLPIYAGMVAYPGDVGVVITPHRRICRGDPANLSELHFGSHTGTHVDAPRHFIDGQESVDCLSLDKLVGKARVLDLSRVKQQITSKDLEQAGLAGSSRVLLKTRNSALWAGSEFDTRYVYLSNEAADFLVESRCKLVGIDYLSIERFHPDHFHVHQTLLGASVVVLEGIDLSSVAPGDYELVCLPLKIKDGDGAPARAILIDHTE